MLQLEETGIKSNVTSTQHTDIIIEIPRWVGEGPFQIRSVYNTATAEIPLPKIFTVRIFCGFTIFWKLQAGWQRLIPILQLAGQFLVDGREVTRVNLKPDLAIIHHIVSSVEKPTKGYRCEEVEC